MTDVSLLREILYACTFARFEEIVAAPRAYYRGGSCAFFSLMRCLGMRRGSLFALRLASADKFKRYAAWHFQVAAFNKV